MATEGPVDVPGLHRRIRRMLGVAEWDWGDHELEVQTLRDRHASLSRREREVMALVVSGLLNKQVGGKLGISEITVKAHRGKVVQKMKAGSFAELVTMAARLRLALAPTD